MAEHISVGRKTSVNEALKAYLAVTAVAVLLAFNYQLFIVCNDFAPAGLNGVATMIQYKTGFSIAYASLIINIPLCAFAYFLIERRFALRSLCFCLVYSAAFLLLQRAGLEEFQYDAAGNDVIFPVLLSGIVSGFVYGVCFRMSASSGGTDIIAKFVSIRRERINFFWMTFALNALVAIASLFVYSSSYGAGQHRYNYDPVCFCLLYCFVSSFIGNSIIKGTKNAVRFTVITAHPDEIAEEVLSVLKHGVTRLEGVGSFTQEKRTVLICVVNRYQSVDFRNIIAKYRDTFAFSEVVNETYGRFIKPPAR